MARKAKMQMRMKMYSGTDVPIMVTNDGISASTEARRGNRFYRVQPSSIVIVGREEGR
jgi:hypothetical protein